MTLFELMDYLKATKGDVQVNLLIQVSRRLSDLAYYEPSIAHEQRESALRLAEAIDDDITAGLSNEPEKLEAYFDAVEFHRGNARHHGYGSLHWRMEERGIEGAGVIEFMALKEHAELLPAYLEMMEPDVIGQTRGALLQSMSVARAEDDEAPIAVLQRLAVTNDGAMTMLLTGEELTILREADTRPEEASNVLASLGLES